MIRTVIEVTGKDDHEFARELKAALDKLGFEPKMDADDIRFRHDLFAALQDRGLVPWELVAELRKKRESIGTAS